MSEIPHAPESNHNNYYQLLYSNRPTNTHSYTLEQPHR